MQINFRMIKRRATKSGTCAVCGKKCSRSITVESSVNPWNKNANGEPKSPSQIFDELGDELTRWKSKPVVHAGCE